MSRNLSPPNRTRPFLLPSWAAEYWAPICIRRPVIESDDVAAIVPVMLGSGTNLYGYYILRVVKTQTDI